jgi:hypothetical protein
MLSGLLSDLLDGLDEDAFPGESNSEVLVEMLTGTVRPVVDAAGRGAVEEATALIGAVADKTLADLRRALELARSRQAPGVEPVEEARPKRRSSP